MFLVRLRDYIALENSSDWWKKLLNSGLAKINQHIKSFVRKNNRQIYEESTRPPEDKLALDTEAGILATVAAGWCDAVVVLWLWWWWWPPTVEDVDGVVDDDDDDSVPISPPPFMKRCIKSRQVLSR